MHISLYKSTLCPRCHLAQKYLLEIASQDTEIQVEVVDVVAAPRQSWNAGIRMIPALKIDNHILSALFLGKTDIADFISRHRH